MSKQFQLRRGTTADNESFTGAEGELTLDTQKQQLRIHDGSTAGGTVIDYVVAWQMPSVDNNFTWYRKYASGWVEQGGTLSGSGSGVTTSLLVTMADSNYTVLFGNRSGNYEQIQLSGRTTTTFTTRSSKGTGTASGCWQVSGIAA